MGKYFYNVIIVANNPREALEVMVNRMNNNKKYGFDYAIEWYPDNKKQRGWSND